MESKKTIDINADLGEFQNASELTNELNILKYISSCSVACGGHIGNAKSITLLLEESKKYGVTVGPHPSYPDKKGFGRRKIDISLKDNHGVQWPTWLVKDKAYRVGRGSYTLPTLGDVTKSETSE